MLSGSEPTSGQKRSRAFVRDEEFAAILRGSAIKRSEQELVELAQDELLEKCQSFDKLRWRKTSFAGYRLSQQSKSFSERVEYNIYTINMTQFIGLFLEFSRLKRQSNPKLPKDMPPSLEQFLRDPTIKAKCILAIPRNTDGTNRKDPTEVLFGALYSGIVPIIQNKSMKRIVCRVASIDFSKKVRGNSER